MSTHAHLDRLASLSEGQRVGKAPRGGVLTERQATAVLVPSWSLWERPQLGRGLSRQEHQQNANRARISGSASKDRIMLMEISHQVVTHLNDV